MNYSRPSPEKPTPWRRRAEHGKQRGRGGFNLTREANPLATDGGQANQGRLIHVSISPEKPTPWRRHVRAGKERENQGFNLTREANPLATQVDGLSFLNGYMFQSHPRSQPLGDGVPVRFDAALLAVSISPEKPTPWRRYVYHYVGKGKSSFNLTREANPLATWYSDLWHPCALSFNLTREANPLATSRDAAG